MTNEDYFAPLIRKIKELTYFPPTLDEVYPSIFKVRHVPKKTHLVRLGEVSDQLFFLSKGSVRHYILRDDKEVVVWFALDHDFVLALQSFAFLIPSPTAIQTLEDSIVLSISRSTIHEMYKQYPQSDAISRMVTECYLLNLYNFYHTFAYLSAQERYDNLLATKPNIFQKAPLYMIASFLGISSETLSRLRAKNNKRTPIS